VVSLFPLKSKICHIILRLTVIVPDSGFLLFIFSQPCSQEVEMWLSYLKSELPMSVSLGKPLATEIINKNMPTWQPALLAK
jgi:hypothetical protein